MGKDRHHHHVEHMQKGKNACAEVLIAVEVMIACIIEPGLPTDHKRGVRVIIFQPNRER